MKTIEEECRSAYISSERSDYFRNGFYSGVEFAQRWIPVEEELPELNERVQVTVSVSGTKGNPEKETFVDHDELLFSEHGEWLFAIEQQCGLRVISWRPIERL